MPVSHPKNVGDQRLPAISDLLQIKSQAFQHARDRFKFGNVEAGNGPVEGAAKCDLFLTWAASSRSRCATGVCGAGGLDFAQGLISTWMRTIVSPGATRHEGNWHAGGW